MRRDAAFACAALLALVGVSGGCARTTKTTVALATAVSSSAPETVIGTSVEGRAIVLLRFGTGPRRLLVLAGVHGDEYGSIVADELASALRVDPSLVPIGSSIDVLPCLNPDGRAAGTKGNAHQTDLNRNLPTSDWSATLDTRDLSVEKGLNGGTAAGSEPETQALLRALAGGYDAVVSLHSAGGLVDFDGPGGETLARALATASGLPIGHLPYQPYIHGSLGEYVVHAGIPLVTVELASPTLSIGLRAGLLKLARTP